MLRRTLPLLLWLYAATAAAADLVATVDRSRIALNETFELTLSYSGRIDSDSVELGQLGELTRDFELLGPPRPQQVFQSRNGAVSYRTSWSVDLLPKRTGDLIIPAFTIAGSTSAPVTIHVGAAPAGDVARNMQVEVSAAPHSIREQQQVLLTVRLTVPSGVGELHGARLEIPGEELHPVAEQNYNQVVDGVAQQVAEWSYALFPRAPGRLEIPAQTFTGARVDGGMRRFDPFGGGGQRIIARSEPIVIDVLPRPDGMANWLPAAALEISSTWSKPVSDIRVGEPVTRTIEIRAVGQQAAVIPALPSQDLGDCKRYPDQPRIEDRQDASGITGIRRESEAIVPSRPGPLVLPEIRITWWNTSTETLDETVLPARTIEVGASTQLQPSGITGSDTSAATTTESTTASDQVPGNDTVRYWRWSTYALGLCCAGLIGLLLGRRRTAATISPVPKPIEEREARLWEALQRSLRRDDAAAIRDALIAWSRSHWPKWPNHTLDALAEFAGDAALARELQRLDAVIYGNMPGGYDAADLAATLAGLRHASAHRARGAPTLAALYPGDSSTP